jgi:hypothetical protein
MKSSIKIIKRAQDKQHKLEEDVKELELSDNAKSVEQLTREMASNIKGWIADLQQRKRDQNHSFPPFIVATANQNT